MLRYRTRKLKNIGILKIMEAEDFLKNCRVKVWPSRYTVLQVKAIPKDFFAIIRDHQELTVVALEGQTARDLIIKEENDWVLLSFEAVLPFELVGFLAIVARSLAEEQISIFALSSYSTDHILVKAAHLEAAKSKLIALGCVFG